MKYVIFFQARSGSSNLATRLNRPEKGSINGFEIVSKQTALRRKLLSPAELSHFGPEAKRLAVTRFFKMHEDGSSVGFKVAPYQIGDDIARFFQHVRQICDKFVFLYRDNFVRVAVSQAWSLERARQKLPPKLDDGEVNTVPRMNIDPGLLDFYLLDAIVEREQIKTLSRLRNDSLLISYEELYAAGDSGFERVRQYLGIPREVCSDSELVRIHSDDLSEHIDNFDEVLRTIRRYGCDESFLVSQSGEARKDMSVNGLWPNFSSLSPGDGFERLDFHDIESTSEFEFKKHSGSEDASTLSDLYIAALSAELEQSQRELANAMLQLELVNERVAHAELYSNTLLTERTKLVEALQLERDARTDERKRSSVQVDAVFSNSPANSKSSL